MLMLAGSCFSQTSEAVDYKAAFADQDACLIIRSIATGKNLVEYNTNTCKNQTSPNSTFKIPAMIIAYEKNIFKSMDQIIKWDGIVHDRKELNQNLNPLTFMKYSAVWVTQWITAQLDIKAIDMFLKEFEYGNRDFSGGKDKAWLDSTLKISPEEQLKFLTKFWKQEFKLRNTTYDLSKKTMLISTLENGVELYGKTGSGREGKDKLWRGWFVGILKTKNGDYVFAARAIDRKTIKEPGGPRVRSTVTDLVQKMKF